MTPSSTTGSTNGSQDDHEGPEANAQAGTGGEVSADAAPAKRPRRRATRSVVSTASVEPIVVGSSSTPAETPQETQHVTTGGTAAVATSSDPAPAAAATKRPRRRATRGISTPTAPVTAAVEPAGAEPAATEPAATESVVTEPAATEPAQPASAPADVAIELPEPVASTGTTQSDASTETPAASGAASLDDIVLPGAAPEPEAPAEKAAPKRRTRKKAAPAAEPVATDTEAAASHPEPAVSAAPQRTRSRRKAAPAEPVNEPTAQESTAQESTRQESAPAETTAPAPAASDDTATTEAPAAPAEQAPKTRARRSRRATAEPAAPATAPAGDATGAGTPAAESATPESSGAETPAAETPAAAAPAAETPAAAPARTGGSPAATTAGTRAPRLATTALLFQAPDDSAARRSRRAQAPAGPPRPQDLTPQFARPVAQTPRAEESTAPRAERRSGRNEAPSAAAGSTSSTRTRSARRGGAAPQAEAAPQTEPAPQAEAAPPVEAPAEPTVESAASEPAAPRGRRSGSRRAVRRTGEPAAQQPTEQQGAEQQPTGQRTTGHTGQDGAERAGAPDAAQDSAASAATPDEAAAAVAPSTPQFTVADLSADDAAAVDEVGAIEDELTAEGVELGELGPEDFEERDDEEVRPSRRRRRRGGRGRRGGRTNRSDDEDDSADEQDDDQDESPSEGAQASQDEGDSADQAHDGAEGEGGSRRRRRRRRGTRGERAEAAAARSTSSDEVTALKGSTRLEAKRQRRREGRDNGRRRQIITEAEFLARRESVERSMIVREKAGRTQIAVLEDGVLVEHYVSQQSQASMAGNVYLGRVQNVLPSMEAAFVDVGKGRNAVLYAGEVNWDAVGLEGQPRRIEQALKSGDSVLVQVTKDPIGHKGARLTSQVTLAGRYLVFVPGGGMTGISRKLPDTERSRLKKILREVVPEGAGVIVRTAAEGASEDELRADVERLQGQWDAIQAKSKKVSAPALLQGEPDMAIRVVRDIFNDDFSSLVVEGEGAWDEIASYVEELAPDLRERVSKWVENTDVFAVHRVDEQLAKGMDRKVWLPSGGSLVIDRTEAMTVVDVNTGKFTGAGGTLEETVTRNNLEAAEEIVRQLRLRDIGGIIVIDFIDMVLESNRDLVLRRLVECLGRDRTKHQVAEVTSLGLVQMTRKRVGQGLVEAFSETCEHCKGRGFIVHDDPIEKHGHSAGPGSAPAAPDEGSRSPRSRRKRGKESREKEAAAQQETAPVASLPEERSEAREAVKATLATIAAAAQHAHEPKDASEGAPTSLDEIQLPDGGATTGQSGATGSQPPGAREPGAQEPDARSSGAREPGALDLPSSSDPAGPSTGTEASSSTSSSSTPSSDAPSSDAPKGGSGTGQPEPPKGAGDEVA